MFRLRTVALITLFAHPLWGGVVMYRTVGGGPSVTLPGPNFIIPANFGRQKDGNLFESFRQFNLNSSQSATFTGPATVQNILARVTNGSPSSIDGTIHSDIQGANLFFMNPAGVLFGQHAQLDVSGSVAVTTANYLKLVDGGRFNANLGGRDVLTSAPVSAFGFLNAAPASVSINGSNTVDKNGIIIPGLGLNVAPQKSFSVVAGDIGINAGYITGQGSRVNLLSVKSAGEAVLDATHINSTVDVTQFTAMGDINITNLALIDTSGPAGGPVVIRGGNLTLDNSKIVSDTSGSTQGGAIDVDITGSITLRADGLISASTSGKGNASDVIVNADSLLIHAAGVTGDTSILARALKGSTGKGGNIAVQVDSVNITNGGRIAATTAGSGDAGNVNITADSFLIGGGAGGVRSAIAANGDTGHGGNVTLQAQNVKITVGGRIAAITQGSGGAGDVTVKADSLLVDGMGVSDASTGIVADVEHGSGHGGSVIVQAHDAKVIDGGLISARTFAKGDGGNVTVCADSLVVTAGRITAESTTSPDFPGQLGTGDAGNVTVRAGDLTITNGGEISSSTVFVGNAGDVTVAADSLRITAGGRISSGTVGPGNGGSINVIADSLSINGANSGILADTSSAGRAGNVAVQARNLTLTAGGEISADTYAIGKGGNVTVTADSLLIDGAGFETGISAGAVLGSSGNAGGVAVYARNLVITDEGEIQSGTGGTGDGGNVNVIADSLLIDGTGASPNIGTGIFGDTAFSSGNGANVSVQARSLTLIGGGQISAETFGAGRGGSVTVAADSLLIDATGAPTNIGTGIFANAELPLQPVEVPGSGDAGKVSVQARSLTLTDDGEISSSSLTSAAAGFVRLDLRTLTMDTDSSISSFNDGSGEAGSVFINTASAVKLKHGASISTSSDLGDAGSIKIISGEEIKLKDQSSITVSAGHNGGDISIMTPDLVYLLNSSITAKAGRKRTGTGVGGTGGNIRIDPQFIVLSNSFINANAAVGQGGNIHLISDFFFNSDLSNNNITATGTTNGTVNIAAPALDLGAELITLPVSLLSAESQLQERCTALLRGDFSSFISIGRGGTEPAPEELQSTF